MENKSQEEIKEFIENLQSRFISVDAITFEDAIKEAIQFGSDLRAEKIKRK